MSHAPAVPRRPILAACWLILLVGPAVPPMPAQTPSPVARPIVIGHRGAPGERPEHTLASYALAIAQGADFIEPDLVPTKDGVLVCRHENDIANTTDVAARPEFAARLATKTVDGQSITGFFTEDFTLGELKTLRATQNRRFDPLRPAVAAQFNGQFEVPTFQEVITLVRQQEALTGRTIGLYPETKHPSYFRAIGLPLEGRLLAALTDNGYAGPDAPVFVQSFEVGNLRALRGQTRLRLVQLLGGPGERSADGQLYDDLSTAAGLAGVAEYANGVGPEKNRLIPRDANGNLLAPTRFVRDAHAASLLVHPYTFRSENSFLPQEFDRGADPADRGDAEGELRLFFSLGVDGVFADFPGTAVAVRDSLTVPEPSALARPRARVDQP